MNYWIIEMELQGAGTRYLTENGTWTNVRREARTFYDVRSAEIVAEKYGGKVVRR